MRNISIDIPRSALSCLTLMLTIACEPAAYEKGIPVETVIMKDKETADAFKNFTEEQIEILKELLKPENRKALLALIVDKDKLDRLLVAMEAIKDLTPEMIVSMDSLRTLIAVPTNVGKLIKIGAGGTFIVEP